jgi:hypothetical protein
LRRIDAAGLNADRLLLNWHEKPIVVRVRNYGPPDASQR